MSRPRVAILIFFVAFAALLVAIHLPYLTLPFFWDELGQFVPAALDLYHDGALVPHSTLPNVHPPGLMAYLALVWRIFGFSILSTRLSMLALASAGVLFSFLLSIRLSRGNVGAPAFAAVLFLIATPIFYTQSMLAQLDLPVTTFTALALLLFLDERYAACALACTVLVLMKETAVTTPVVFGAWLWFRDKRRREALYFVAPLFAMAAWLLILKRATGHWLGNPEFAQYNVAESLSPVHIVLALARRVYFLFIADGRFIGALALFAGWPILRGRNWTVATLVAAAQILIVTVLGGAMLERYTLPVLPILYAAMAAAASVYPVGWRRTSHIAMAALLVVGLFWNPPYPFPWENNLAMTDFVRLEQDAASFLEALPPGKRIATVWPFTDALRHPEFGYVRHPLQVQDAAGFGLDDLANLDRARIDMLVVYSRVQPLEGHALDVEPIRLFLRRYFDYRPQATTEELSAGLGYVPIVRWVRGGQWIEILIPGQ